MSSWPAYQPHHVGLTPCLPRKMTSRVHESVRQGLRICLGVWRRWGAPLGGSGAHPVMALGSGLAHWPFFHSKSFLPIAVLRFCAAAPNARDPN